jgi:serine protease Do
MNGTRFRWLAIIVIVVLAISTITNGVLLFQANGKLDEAQMDINSLQGQVSSLTSSNTTLINQLSSLSGKLSSLEGEFSLLQTETDALRALSTAVVDSVAAVYPSVVYVYVEVAGENPGDFFSLSGSGVILSSDGYILTNRHVVEGAVYSEVVLQDRRVFIPEEIILDDIMDLAVIKIDGQNLPFAPIGDAESLSVGDVVIALGHPLGISPEEGGATVTYGIVSNLGRSFWIEDNPYYDVIQTDAAISPGNSGGPLIDLFGEVIGINSAGIDIGQNLNYAISMATAGHVYEDLVTFGEAHHPYLGVSLVDNVEFEPGGGPLAQINGALIIEVESGSPADLGGLEPGDIIVALDGVATPSVADLIKHLWRQHSGDTVTFTVQRGASEIEISILLEERPDDSG